MMEALRRSSHGDRELGSKKHRYMQFTKEIEAAVEAGKLSEEEAEEKLIAVRREMFEEKRGDEGEPRELKAKKRRYEQVTREIKEAHEAGKITEEEAEEKLIHLRREMFEHQRHSEAEARELQAKKRRYEQAARKIKEAHEAGKISEEDAEEKLIDLRREMFEEEHHDGKESRELQADKRRYEQAARKIKEAHEAGKISEEEAEEKLSLLRRKMFDSEEN